jgi:small multidrug resistance pump
MNPITTYLCLAGAILTEAVATIALAASESLSKPIPSAISVAGFVAAFWLLSFPLRTMPTGIVYAVWSGLGIVLITAIAWVWSKQALDVPALVGMALITAGVIVINVFSKSEGSATADRPLAQTQQDAADAATACSAAKSPSTECR